MTGFELTGRHALVTGASRGIGRAVALAFARAGADLALVARGADALAEVATEVESYGRRAVVLPTDVTDRDAVAAAVEGAVAGLGGVDLVVNNAGGNSFMAPFTQIRPSGWEKTLRLNLESAVWLLHAVGPHLLERGRGSVINVASVAGLRSAPLMPHYGAAKAALLSLTRSLAVEWAHAGVRVNALVPGWVATDLTDFARASSDVERGLLERVPMGRWATPDEIALPAVFLASDASAFMTGQELVVDGGLTAT